MRLGDIIVLFFEIIFYGFHLSLLIVLIAEHKTKFHGAFYNMLRLLFISDILIFLSSFEARIATYGFWHEYFETDTFFATLSLDSAFYLLIMQFLIHAFIPLNRFTLFWFPLSYKKIWSSKQWYTVFIIFAPILILSPWLPESAEFVFTQSRNVILRYANLKAVNSSFIMTFSFCCLMTLVGAAFNSLAIIRYYIHKKRGSGIIQVNEITFLYMSCILFIAHSFYCVTLIGRMIFMHNPFIAYLLQSLAVIVMDIIAWTGSASLIALSKQARKSYIQFYAKFWRKKLVLTKVSTAKRIPQNNYTVSRITQNM